MFTLQFGVRGSVVRGSVRLKADTTTEKPEQRRVNDMVTIRLRKNGPYVVEGDDVRVVDWEGREYVVERRPAALCRCGASTKKPFCDGTHSRIGFQAAEAAVPESKE